MTSKPAPALSPSPKRERKPLSPESIAKISAGRTSPFWRERDAALRELYGQGLMMSAIAAQLGVTKNQVIGRVNRLG